MLKDININMPERTRRKIMTQEEQILNCNQDDFLQILSEIEDFWGSDRTLLYHHPMFVNEFGNTSFIIKENEKVLAYLFGFISQTEKTGYVHLVGVRQSHQRHGLGQTLYEHFIQKLKNQNITGLKAITTPTNSKSINFHLKLGMEMIGELINNDIKVIKNYSGYGQDRVVFQLKI
jgi:GNAT superfamily N-acetyltransferase